MLSLITPTNVNRLPAAAAAMTHARPLRAGLYYRVSTKKQDHSLQVDELRQLASQRGWTVAEYIDTVTGSGKKAMPERERLLRDAQAGQLSAVLVWKFDRWARSLRDLVDTLESFKAWGIAFVSLRDQIDTSTPIGKLVFQINAAYAEFEREVIRERVIAGLAAAKRHGTRSGRPIGRQRVAIDMGKVFELRAAGLGVKAVARQLHLEPSTLRRALRRGEQNPTLGVESEVRENTSNG